MTKSEFLTKLHENLVTAIRKRDEARSELEKINKCIAALEALIQIEKSGPPITLQPARAASLNTKNLVARVISILESHPGKQLSRRQIVAELERDGVRLSDSQKGNLAAHLSKSERIARAGERAKMVYALKDVMTASDTATRF